MSCPELEVSSPIMVDAQIHRWTITNDNIYLLKFQEAPPQWVEDIVNSIIDDTGLADDVTDLENRFANFEEGYSEHFYDWKDGDTETLAYVETMYTTNTVFNAGIQEIKVAYVSYDESGAYFDQLIGAWQTGAGGAWFNEKVSVVSNVAYSAAKSASTLTATMKSQQGQLEVIVGDIDVLEKQIDGVVETWFDTHDISSATGDIILSAAPYNCWLAGVTCPEYDSDTDEDTRSLHTGDSYVKYELDVNGNKQYMQSYRFARTEIDEPYTDADGYAWVAVTDSRAEEAYQAALKAQVTADGKINSFYGPTPPNILTDPTLGKGDLWLDSDDHNKMYRYSGTAWIAVRDTDITASVNRLDEATVDVNGIATAKSSLVVNADGNISGYRANATNNPNDPGSTFRIFADKFVLAATNGQPAANAPFTVDTTTKQIKFNGVVEFTNIEGGDDIVTVPSLTTDLARTSTIISGSRILTGSVNAKYIAADTIWTGGSVRSADYNGYATSNYVGGNNFTGFMLSGDSGSGSYNYPNVYGAYIRAATLDAGIVKYQGMKWESTTAGYYGRLGHSGSSAVSFSTSLYDSYTASILIRGPSNGGSGSYYKERVLSRSASTVLLQANAATYMHSGGGTLGFQYSSNGSTWVNFGPAVGVGYQSGVYPGLSYNVPLTTYLADNGYMYIRAYFKMTGSHNAGTLNFSLVLNN